MLFSFSMLSGLKKREISKQELDSILSNLSEKIRHLVSPRRIIVFGSAATNQLRQGSDLDICILFDSENEAKEAKKVILSLPPLIGLATDYLFMSEQRFNERKNEGGVCVEIADKGRILFEREAS